MGGIRDLFIGHDFYCSRVGEWDFLADACGAFCQSGSVELAFFGEQFIECGAFRFYVMKDGWCDGTVLHRFEVVSPHEANSNSVRSCVIKALMTQ